MPLNVPGRVPRRAVRTRGGRSAHAPPRGMAGWPRPPRPAKPKRDGRTAQPGEWAHRNRLLGLRGSSNADRGDGRVRRTARSVEQDGRRAVQDGSAADGRGVRAMCARREAQCSPPRVAAFGTAVRWAWYGNEAGSISNWCALDGGCLGARGFLPCDPYLEPAIGRVTA